MTDVFNKRKRSEIMSRIRGSGNKRTELAFIKLLRKNKISGWRRNFPLFGKPDFVFPKQRIAIFVDGCFWHGCPDHASWPKQNALFWKKKIESNKSRDCLVNDLLSQKGWRVIRVWQHELKSNAQAKVILQLFSLRKHLPLSRGKSLKVTQK